jgi:LPS-assembly lipoprotein
MRSGSLRPARRRLIGVAVALPLASLLTACGFRLRQAPDFAFKSLYIGAPSRSRVAAEFKRQLRASPGLTLTDDAQTAQSRLEISRELREKEITSFSTAGRPREYQLRLRITYRLVDSKGRELIAVNEMLQRREVTTSDAELIAKEQEDQIMYREMESDIVQQLIFRIAAVRL